MLSLGLSNCFAPHSHRPLGSVRAFTAQWTCVQCPVYARTLPSGRRKVQGKKLENPRRMIGNSLI